MLGSEVSNSIDSLIDKGLPFACWSLPGSTDCHGVAQRDAQKHFFKNDENEGFVVADFLGNEEPRLINADLQFSKYKGVYVDIKDFPNRNVEEVDNLFQISHESYLEQCRTLIDELQKGELEKVVLSRIKKKEVSESPSRIFEKLCEAYPNAMVFIYRKDDDLWLGATPETFFLNEDDEFVSMALAGSKASESADDWTAKERKEQAYVEDHIEAVFEKENILYDKTGPETVNAGPVSHLRTLYKGKVEKHKIMPLLARLHPTPAVCGIPTNKAKSSIQSIEKHKRRDYTGFLGPVGKRKMKLFVNLRSGLISGDGFYLFLGGGITKDSIAEKEWKETELKAKTLLSIL